MNITPRKALGGFLISIPFIIMLIGMALTIGIKAGLIILLFTGAVVGLIGAATWLLMGN